jgi:hypothetical protein
MSRSVATEGDPARAARFNRVKGISNMLMGGTGFFEPGGWIYKDLNVRMDTQFQRLSTGLFASAGQIVWNRFTGPGRVAIQSMYMHMPTAE